ncbi:McrC family protein [Lentiprolixibacter aurantiacus]|uniref:Restriction endonuclease n=1 Tax=Lentiprolixibacter aurantiacus TaxID=2993939 RepID=A0AAE3SMX1_9FLAO|nr:restriction endonuclease [Lentiprolixibacter aurantiacus]MCX2718756.1 restriction endonuclease [Lentiprolixibacter aurantiacus]
MSFIEKISVFEHQRLYVGDKGFTDSHLEKLLALNDQYQTNFFQPIPRGVKFNQYVGVIQIDGLSIEINPKADKNDKDGKWRGKLLKMLSFCNQLKATPFGPGLVEKQNLNLLYVYFEIYLNELDRLIRLGLVKQYRKETSNTKALKGKLDFAGNIRYNLIHKERFYTTHQVYDANHLLHQILLKALQIVSFFSKGSYLFDQCKRISLNFPISDPLEINSKHLTKVVLNRKTKEYEYALELAKLIISNSSPDIETGEERILSILFDMNKLWEEFVGLQLRKVCLEKGIGIQTHQKKNFWNNKYLEPDIILSKGNDTYVIDTKWKLPLETSVSNNDLKQIYSYCRFWKAKKGLLLYPGDETLSEEFANYNNKDYIEGRDKQMQRMQHQCKIGFVSVIDTDSNKLSMDIGQKVIELLEI